MSGTEDQRTVWGPVEGYMGRGSTVTGGRPGGSVSGHEFVSDTALESLQKFPEDMYLIC